MEIDIYCTIRYNFITFSIIIIVNRSVKRISLRGTELIMSSMIRFQPCHGNGSLNINILWRPLSVEFIGKKSTHITIYSYISFLEGTYVPERVCIQECHFIYVHKLLHLFPQKLRIRYWSQSFLAFYFMSVPYHPTPMKTELEWHWACHYSSQRPRKQCCQLCVSVIFDYFYMSTLPNPPVRVLVTLKTKE